MVSKFSHSLSTSRIVFYLDDNDFTFLRSHRHCYRRFWFQVSLFLPSLSPKLLLICWILLFFFSLQPHLASLLELLLLSFSMTMYAKHFSEGRESFSLYRNFSSHSYFNLRLVVAISSLVYVSTLFLGIK